MVRFFLHTGLRYRLIGVRLHRKVLSWRLWMLFRMRWVRRSIRQKLLGIIILEHSEPEVGLWEVSPGRYWETRLRPHTGESPGCLAKRKLSGRWRNVAITPPTAPAGNKCNRLLTIVEVPHCVFGATSWSLRAAKRKRHDYSACSPRSSLRMRIASSTRVRKILPSPIFRASGVGNGLDHLVHHVVREHHFQFHFRD